MRPDRYGAERCGGDLPPPRRPVRLAVGGYGEFLVVLSLRFYDTYILAQPLCPDLPLGGTLPTDPAVTTASFDSDFDQSEAPTCLADEPVTEQLAAASDLETIATEPIVAIDPPIWPTYYMISTSSLAPESLYFCVAEPSEVLAFPPSGELEFVDFEGQDTSYIASLNSGVDPTFDEGISLLLGSNPDTFGDSGVNLSLEHVETPPIEILANGEILSIDSDDLAMPFAPICTTWVTEPPESFDNIAVEGTESAMETDPLILANYHVMSVTNFYNGSIDWEIKPLPFSGDSGVVDVEASETLSDSTFAKVNSPDLMGCPEPVADRGVSLPLLSVCQDYPVPEVSSPVGEATEADRDPEPRTGILFRGEIHTMVSADLVQPHAPIAPPPVNAPPENLRSTTAEGGTERPKGAEAVAEASPAPGMATAISIQPPQAQPAADPITGIEAWAQPTGAVQPSPDGELNLPVGSVLNNTSSPAGFGSPWGKAFPFAQDYTASLPAPSRQDSGETLPMAYGSVTAEGSTQASTSTLIASMAGLGSSVRDPFVMGWGIESVIPPLIADLIPDIIMI